MKHVFVILLLCAYGFAAVTRDGSCASRQLNHCLSGFSATNTGSLKIVFSWNEVFGSPPSLPSGWTNIATGSGGTSFWRMGCNVSSSSADTGTGTWTNASVVVGISYSGTGAISTANCNTTGVGNNSSDGPGGDADFSCHSITMTGTNWVACFGGNPNNSICTPSGLTQVVTAFGSTNNGIGLDTNAPVSTFSTATCSNPGATWSSATVEIKGASPSGHCGSCDISKAENPFKEK